MSGPSTPGVVSTRHASLEDPKAVENLFGRLKEYESKEKENVVSSGITKKYQENQNKAAAWLEATNEINNSKDIGPTKRLELQDSLNKDRAFIIQEQNQLNAQAKALEEQKIEREKLKKAADEAAVKKSNDKKAAANALRIGGETNEEVIDAKSDYLTPEQAKFEAQQNIAKSKPVKTLGSSDTHKNIIKEVINPNRKAANSAKDLLLEAPDYLKAIEAMKEGSALWKQALNVLPGGVGKTAVENSLNGPEQIINSITKKSILTSGDLKGLRITDEKLRYIQGALPGPLKNYEANIAAFKIWKRTQELLAKRGTIQDELIRELDAKGIKEYPGDFDALLEEKMHAAGLQDELDGIVEDAKNIEGNENAAGKEDERPPASSNNGKRLQDAVTGKIYKSNGKEWIEQ